jgi:RimJ/RimL family protein N-acetyltransferase
VVTATQRPEDIQTERLILSVLMPDEIDALLAGDIPYVEQAMGLRYPLDDPNRGVDLNWHLRSMRADSNQIPWRIRVIVERSSNTVIGSINGKGPPDDRGDFEIGWGLNQDAQGKGYASEAAAAVVQWAFQQPGVCSVSATIPDDNIASQQVAQRLGFTRTVEIRRGLPIWKCENTGSSRNFPSPNFNPTVTPL